MPSVSSLVLSGVLLVSDRGSKDVSGACGIVETDLNTASHGAGVNP